MKKLILFLLLLATMPAMAQGELKFGFLSYNIVMQAMPEYAAMQNSMAELREKYEAEQKRVENDFNKKYEEFLDGLKNFPKTILQKRQSELQELMERNIRFKEESKKELEQTEKLLLAPLKIRLIEQLGTIARERGYAFIVDTDQKALPYINPSMGEDITLTVQDALK